jgi:hypothetical protein
LCFCFCLFCLFFKQEKQLLGILVGDALVEPFWPLGTGANRAILSSLDAAWSVKVVHYHSILLLFASFFTPFRSHLFARTFFRTFSHLFRTFSVPFPYLFHALFRTSFAPFSYLFRTSFAPLSHLCRTSVSNLFRTLFAWVRNQ